MAKKNSSEFQVFTSVPGVVKIEGTLLSVSSGGVMFSSRKPGGQNRLEEFIPRQQIAACIGNEGKEATLFKLDNTVIFGNKQRNTQMLQNPESYGDSHLRGASGEFNTVIVNTAFSRLVLEIKSEEGGRGRKPGKPKAEKAAKGKAKPSKSGKSKSDTWDE
jgi:hypothetical protein